MQLREIPNHFWEEVSINFITGLLKYEGNNVIMVVIYQLKRYAHFHSLFHPFKTIIVETTFMEIV